jgi:NAD(P)-dependent dehydrogenase (short-subunit alcohol dehydrogenase family)
MVVLVTGGDTDLGRTIAAGFRDAGHEVVIAGARRDELEIAAKELDVESIVFDNTDPASVAEIRSALPHHLHTVVNVPAPRHDAGDPRGWSLTDHAAAWRHTFDATLVSAVLTVQIAGDNLSSGGTILTVVPGSPTDGSADAAVKAAVSDWTAGQAAHFGTRGITVNAVAAGKAAEPTYDGLGGTDSTEAGEFARLAVFLATPAARHITGQTLHVSRGALAHF